MTRLYRNMLSEMRDQDKANAKANEQVELQKIDRDGLVIDANDTAAEIEKNLKSNISPIDTLAEIEAKGLNKKSTPEDEEPENSSSFRP